MQTQNKINLRRQINMSRSEHDHKVDIKKSKPTKPIAKALKEVAI